MTDEKTPDVIDVSTADAAAEQGGPDVVAAQSPEPPVAVEPDDADRRFRGTFRKLSGYGADDIAATNVIRRTVVTTNGGKYLVSKNGKQLKVLAGPYPPSAAEGTESEA